MIGSTTTAGTASQRTGAPRRLDPRRMRAVLAARQAEGEIERLTAAMGRLLAERAEDRRVIAALRAEDARKDAVIRDLTLKVRRLERDAAATGGRLGTWGLGFA